MASPGRVPPGASSPGRGPVSNPTPTQLPGPAPNLQSQPSEALMAGHKKRKHRNRKRRNRRQSFATTLTDPDTEPPTESNSNLLGLPENAAARASFYRLGQPSSSGRRNLSSTSIESSTLLDHREQQSMRPRRPSVLGQTSSGRRQSHGSRTALGLTQADGTSSTYRSGLSSAFRPGGSQEQLHRAHRYARAHDSSRESSDEDEPVADDRTPLISVAGTAENRESRGSGSGGGYEGLSSADISNLTGPRRRRKSNATSTSSRHLRPNFGLSPNPSRGGQGEYNVNYPPSVPGSPSLDAHRQMAFDDVMLTESFHSSRSPERRRGQGPLARDTVIDMTGRDVDPFDLDSPVPSPGHIEDRRRSTILQAQEDVCFPVETMSEIADEEIPQMRGGEDHTAGRRRRGRRWPDLPVLEGWSRDEKECRSEGIRAKKLTEPVLVGGRLRPSLKAGWHRTEEDAPYRFTYFNEEFAGTVHSQTISELLQPGQTFRDLFIPDPPELSDDSSDDEEEEEQLSHQSTLQGHNRRAAPNGESRAGTRHGSLADMKSPTREPRSDIRSPPAKSHSATPTAQQQPGNPPKKEKEKRFGARPTFWLDVLSPTEEEMKVLSKAFGIHPLTAEDIMMQEAREKVELFRNYYFVNYRTFEQDMNSEDFLEPVNMYVVVFREGVLSFHFSMTPHPANVRRRIRQLKDYLILSADWISYAIIDDITDVFFPLIQSVEDEVDDIDDAVLQLHSPPDKSKDAKDNEKKSEAAGQATESGGDMLRRVGDCRKKVMGLYRLLGNKADVIKGFAKRCNEQWEIAPRSEIGLYLGDIQDHIVTMTSNLSHYEKILSRSHSNYLAQINIRMNERQEQTADVLGRLTVLGTIVLPMNIITGLWGMNVLVPGQDVESLNWFWSITVALFCFGFCCYFIARKVYKIV